MYTTWISSSKITNLYTWSRKSSNWITQERCFSNRNFNSLKYGFRKVYRCIKRQRSKTFDTMLKRETSPYFSTFDFKPFLKVGLAVHFFQQRGKTPVRLILWNNLANYLLIVLVHHLNEIAGNWSGPLVFF